ILIDPILERPLVVLKHEIDRIAAPIEPRLDLSEQRLEPLARHRRDDARIGGVACGLALDARPRSGVETIGLVPDFEQALRLSLDIDAKFAEDGVDVGALMDAR